MESNLYTDKDFLDKIDSLKNEMSDLKNEMTETRTLIRDYNGLRKKVDDTAEIAKGTDAKLSTIMWGFPVVVVIISFIVNWLTNVFKK